MNNPHSVLQNNQKSCAVLSLGDVSKAFTSRQGICLAVNKVNLAVTAGEVVGLVGPNRAGKSTLLKLAVGLLGPTNGGVLLFGQAPKEKAGLMKTGVMLESPRFPPYLKLRDLICFLGGLSNIPYSQLPQKVDEVLTRVGLNDRANSKVGTFSRGMIQRVMLAQALLHQPQFLVLDEPTEGMDVEGVELLKKEILAVCQRQGAVLIASHALEEVEALADRVGLMSEGQLHWLKVEKEARSRGWIKRAIPEYLKKGRTA